MQTPLWSEQALARDCPKGTPALVTCVCMCTHILGSQGHRCAYCVSKHTPMQTYIDRKYTACLHTLAQPCWGFQAGFGGFSQGRYQHLSSGLLPLPLLSSHDPVQATQPLLTLLGLGSDFLPGSIVTPVTWAYLGVRGGMDSKNPSGCCKRGCSREVEAEVGE